MPDMAALYVAQHGWLRRRLGDAHQSADLAQDTFVRLLSPVAGGTALPPLTGMSKEIGIKGALLDGKLNTSFVQRGRVCMGLRGAVCGLIGCPVARPVRRSPLAGTWRACTSAGAHR